MEENVWKKGNRENLLYFFEIQLISLLNFISLQRVKFFYWYINTMHNIIHAY